MAAADIETMIAEALAGLADGPGGGSAVVAEEDLDASTAPRDTFDHAVALGREEEHRELEPSANVAISIARRAQATGAARTNVVASAARRMLALVRR